MKRQIKLFLLLSVVLLVPMGILQYHQPLELVTGNYRIGVADYAIGMENTNRPGEYYTISPFDDLIIMADGSEQKLAQNSQGPSSSWWFTLKTEAQRIINDWHYFFTKSVTIDFSYKFPTLVNYRVNVEDRQIKVTREIRVTGQEVVGIGKSLIVPPEDTILIDGVPLQHPQRLEDQQVQVIENAQILMLVDPQVTDFIKVNLNPQTDRVVIDWRYNLVTIKSFYSQSKHNDFEDTQDFEIVKIK